MFWRNQKVGFPWGELFPEASTLDAEIIETSLSMSMTSRERLWALMQAVKYVEKRDIAGDFVEAGVWKGGSSYLVARLLRELDSSDRTLWLYDTYSGMPVPEPIDRRFDGTSAAQILESEQSNKTSSNTWAISSLEESKQNILQSGYPENLIRFVEGKVETTLLSHVPERIAILRLDTDWYSSTKAELEILTPRLSPGAVVIVDDYGHWEGARRAVDEYLSTADIFPLINRIDQTGRMWLHSE